MNTKSLKKINKLIETAKRKHIAKNIYSGRFFNDEPKVYSFSVVWKSHNSPGDSLAGGCSFLKDRALIKTLGEAFERYVLSIYQESSLIWDSYSNLKNSKRRAINPKNFVSFSYSKTKPNFNIYENEFERLNWIEGTSLTQEKNVFVPAQLVFVPYKFKPKEPVIRFPITTGAACYSSLEGAILNGLLEVIERDAFMINYLNKLSRNIVDFRNSSDKMLHKIISSINRYNLELYVLDISTDVPVYTILAIIIDRTGLGPAVSLGMKSDLEINRAIIGAVEECLHGRFWIRGALMKTKKTKMEEIKKRKYYIDDIKERGLLWSAPQMINKIKFFLAGKKILLKDLPLKKVNGLSALLTWFKKAKIEVVYIDVTPFSLKRKRIYIVKVMIPQFQPLYLDERFPCWGGKRLKEVPQKLGFKPLKEVYKFPHPFL